ncbi:hypothetical protein F5Y16DRAFT_402547 [Xylariaceae sp. FL0255]|nr:hypothetical protein F5Y16DRAFT_402547 [Xylariaceae sp. FL0255]
MHSENPYAALESIGDNDSGSETSSTDTITDATEFPANSMDMFTLAVGVRIISVEEPHQNPVSARDTSENSIASIKPPYLPLDHATVLSEDRARDLLSALCTVFSFNLHPGQVTASMLQQCSGDHGPVFTVFIAKNQGVGEEETGLKNALMKLFNSGEDEHFSKHITENLSYFKCPLKKDESDVPINRIIDLLLNSSDSLEKKFLEGIQKLERLQEFAEKGPILHLLKGSFDKTKKFREGKLMPGPFSRELWKLMS